MNKSYAGTTKRGQAIHVTFYVGTAGDYPSAIVSSKDLCFSFKRYPVRGWRSFQGRLDDEWGPVIDRLYLQYLDDIVANNEG